MEMSPKVKWPDQTEDGIVPLVGVHDAEIGFETEKR